MLLVLMGLGDFLGVWGLDKKKTEAEGAEGVEKGGEDVSLSFYLLRWINLGE